MKFERCVTCNQKVEVEDDYEVEYCCSGLSEQCGCMGLPVNPVFCNDCEENIFGK